MFHHPKNQLLKGTQSLALPAFSRSGETQERLFKFGFKTEDAEVTDTDSLIIKTHSVQHEQ